MKTSHRIKILRLGVFTAIALTFSLPSLAAPFSERNAFCVDRMREWRSNYENQKIYNECMKNADALIEEYEQYQRDLPKLRLLWEAERIEREKQWEKERAEREARQEAQRRAEWEAQRLKDGQEIKRIDDLFRNFD